ncbi:MULTISPECIES: dihydrofolate reductase family protein [Microbacterium]|uniref:Dihydrofolate reductase n=1 Tax=Microbacterium wangchenii TaxID=2541726 RepID=A0ABX5SU32_9MICO|nr:MULTISPECIES: dihydrofolate reductase family protein [Microbacterium]MCK6065267.1 dihydrofolate reductase family protein [Microbacterium sp. EYE_512]QBR88716.1 dihydrofolate reductase [Microbacterium wangchenii]TXK20440.1 dihydrofolate reductase [Microbacterium wangchenii]
MVTTVFYTAVTANGFLADEHDSLDWLFAVPGAEDAENDMGDFLATVGAFVMGAATYEWVLRHEEEQRPGMWAESYGALPCFVVTHRTLAVPPGANVRFVQGDVASFWPDLVEAAGDGALWLVGGGDLVGQFDDAGHLDQIRLSVAPAFLPAGKPLLPRRIGPERLQLESARASGQFVEVAYRVLPAAP